MYYRFFYAFKMLTIQFIRDNRDIVIERLKIKNFKQPELIDRIIARDNDRRSFQVQTNELQADLNQFSKEIGILYRKGEQEKANEVKERTTDIKADLETFRA